MRTPRILLALPLVLSCAGDTGIPELDGTLSGLPGMRGSVLDEATVVAGLREAVASTSRPGGFLANERIRIRPPESLDTMARTLRTVGLGRQVDGLEVAMNHAAEQAAGEALDVFWTAIRRMTVRDAFGVLEGSETAATDYFRRTTSDDLRARFAPIVEEKMSAVGLVRLYDDLVARYRATPLGAVGLAGEPPDLRTHVTQAALDGLFTVLGQEEARIRRDPAARTTELLRRVFGP